MLIGIDASRANHKQRTGVEKYAFQLIQHLKEITPDTVQVVLYTDKPLQGDLARLPENWTQKVLKWPPKRLWTQIRLSFEMLMNPPDVLFIPAHVFPIIHPAKTVMTVHDIAAIRFPKSYNWFERWYSVWSAKVALKKLWKVITPSQFTKEELKKLGNLETGKLDKIKVVYHGYDKRYAISDKNIENINKILIKYSIEKPYLLSIGRLEEKKNTINIIKAFEKLKIDLKLVLVGKPGFGYEKVKQAIEQSSFKNDIITPGWVNEDDLPYLMRGAEVFVFPSLYEGFGLPVLEAMVAGVPVVASHGASLSEVGGEAAVYVDPLNTEKIVQAVMDLLQNEKLRIQKITAGKERIKNFSWEKCAGKTLELLLLNS